MQSHKRVTARIYWLAAAFAVLWMLLLFWFSTTFNIPAQ